MNRPVPHPRRGRKVTWLAHCAAWVAVLCLAGQVSSALHFLLVSHVTCPEHGEWIHAVAAHGRPDADEAHRPPIGQVMVDATASSPTHDHEHCAVVTERRAIAFPHRFEIVAWAPETPVETRADIDAERACHHDVYVVAPKTSPPV